MMGSEGNLFLLKMSCYSSLPGGHSSLNEAGPQLDDQLAHFLVRGIQISSGIVHRWAPTWRLQFEAIFEHWLHKSDLRSMDYRVGGISLHEVELICMVDTEFGKASIWVQSIFTLEERKHEQINDFTCVAWQN